jgi:hypothetical protein
VTLLIILLNSAAPSSTKKMRILISAYVKRIGINATIFVSSFYYAALHFIKTKTSIAVDQAEFSDSFGLLGEAFQNVLNPEHFGAFWALLMVGFFLAVMRTIATIDPITPS